MADFDQAFIERLVASCSSSEGEYFQRKRKQRGAPDPIPVLSTASYPATLEILRDRLIELAETDLELRHHTAFEWFLDNFYLITETAQTLREDVPASFYRTLPIVQLPKEDGVERLPRAYHLAAEVFAHGDAPPGRVCLEEFLVAFQAHIPLGIGELWAFPAMLRAICLETIVDALTRLCHASGGGRDVEEGSLKAEGVSLSKAVRTLIELKTVPWRLVFEHTSLVHKELLRDPAGVYGKMDFATCDRYRKEVEKLAVRAGVDEFEVAAHANLVAEGIDDELCRHVGYWLIDRGRADLERALQLEPTPKARLARFLRRFATPVYLLAIAVATLAILALIAAYLVAESAGPAVIFLACVIACVPASAFAIAGVQWIIMALVKPHRLPRLAMEQGIAAENRSIVVIPTLLGDLSEVHELVQQLELHYLANPDPNLCFAILADYTDALSATTDLDKTLLVRAQGGIELLNQRHGSQGVGPFHLLVRNREFNESEGVWMGWERKRGKLEEFNRLLAGNRDTSYSTHIGNAKGLKNIRFVITLDSDTQLPRDAACKLVATLAHPLNRAHFEGDRLSSGYTVLQPRLDISPDACNQSRFTRIFAGDTGLDIYSRAVSNVYQDFFGSGVYVGKGIYDVDAFRRCLEGRVPENALLSHDLFEGIYGRAGLVTDVVLYEDYPSSYLAYARRLHRWIRGDWQLLPWLGRRVPSGTGSRIANPFSQIDRWKVVDNLRRSLLPVTLLALLVSGWTWLPGSSLAWTVLALALSAGHVLTGMMDQLWTLLGRPLREVGRSLVGFSDVLYRWLLSLAFLPHEAVIVADAVARTSMRMALTRKRLLEWTSAAHTANFLARAGQRSLLWWEMLGGPISALCVGAAIFALNPGAIAVALGFLFTWFISPEIALFLARSPASEIEELKPEQAEVLRHFCRRTWLFFETFVGPDDHWLPPDNVQMVPSLRIAHRTSPTNIGLYLASCATACDLGYIGLRDFCVRIQSTMRTLKQVPRHRGQLLNWYETQTLNALLPKYVSTVDNGNMAAALIAVRQACGDFATGPIFRQQSFSALRDVVDLLSESVSRMRAEQQLDPRIEQAVARMREMTEETDDPDRWIGLLGGLQAEVETILEFLSSAVRVEEGSSAMLKYEALDWLEILTREIGRIQALIHSFANWFHTLSSAPATIWRHGTLRKELPGLRAQCYGASLEQFQGLAEKVEKLLSQIAIDKSDTAGLRWALSVREQLALAVKDADALLGTVLDAGVSCEAEIATIDFGFLYDEETNLMFIGYDASSSQPDIHHYDLLASESRLASLIAIAFGQVPTKHWFHLGRPIARVSGASTLLSWSGTMFEYLMPLLFTRSFPRTLLGRSASASVARQIEYGQSHGLPWGISESAFASTDAKGDYQYRAFGTPGLGLKRGLEEDMVIAPYASALAVGLRPSAVVKNLELLRDLDVWGEYGAMEAIDYTPKRSETFRSFADARSGAVVQAYMAHHQGMSMVAIGNVLAEESMMERFHADPRVQTVAHLLQERLPADTPNLVFPEHEAVVLDDFLADRVVFPESWQPNKSAGASSSLSRIVDPALHIVSNGSLNLLCDSFGRSRLWLTHGHEEIDIRAHEAGDSNDRAGGFCLYMQVAGEPSRLISGGLAVGAATPESSEREVLFWPHKVETRTHWGALAALEEVFIVPHDNVEVRRLRVTNEGSKAVDISLVGYGEIAIQRAGEHNRHPAFSRLFLETSSLEEGRILMCRRRARGPDERFPVVAQALLVPDAATSSISAWETSRASFIGRTASLDEPQWLAGAGNVARAGQQGHVLDPALAQRVELTIAAGQSQTLAWVTAVGIDDERALEALLPYSQLSGLPVIHDQAARVIGQRLAHVNLSTGEAATCQHLLSRLVHRAEVCREPAPKKADRRQLWAHGISGDLPILLLHRRSEDIKLVQLLLRAHRFFVEQNFIWDLVIVVHEAGGYVDEAREQIRRIARTQDRSSLHSNVTILSAAQVRAEGLDALEAAAGCVLDSEAGELSDQLQVPIHQPKLIPAFLATRAAQADAPSMAIERREDLLFDNGFGGFDEATSEYVIFLDPLGTHSSWPSNTPAPWCNVLSNTQFGALVSERGLGSSWSGNASENRLTPWSNDPICDPPSEVLYLRDEETAEAWSPTPGPMPAPLPYEVAHGIGYTRFRHRSHELMQTLRVSVHATDPVKLVELVVENLSDGPRRLTATYFADWVLGTRSATYGPFVIPSYDPDARAVLASNPWNNDFPEQVAFLAASESVHGFTVDPIEFLGLGGLQDPDSLRRWGLSNSQRCGALSCAALQVHVDLQAGERRRLHFALGWGESRAQALALASRSTAASYPRESDAALEEKWHELLGRIVVSTPDAATNLMLNSWALYQTLSSRLYARTGFYQSSGAIGFRDQLQDLMSLTVVAPKAARDHILVAAAHQFESGDVLHWWHPPRGHGVRTRCSDDLLWLPAAVARYIETTGDLAILDEEVPFLSGPELGPEEHDHYGDYAVSLESASISEHCLRAIDRGYAIGDQGLPLIGGGDWNDGMNLVGVEGKGQSVWLGWFLYDVMRRFAAVSEIEERTGDLLRLSERCKDLLGPLESAWDGAWYRRAYYDDGTPLGSASSTEARIDSISQSWAVLSGAAPPERARQAVDSAVRELFDPESQIIRLLWPPFDRDAHEPGYIKGYPPGIRENGAQYTHAATWLVWSLFAIGDNERAAELFGCLNPINHGRTTQEAEKYVVEPYVLSGDVYSTGTHRGRGGWSWYTGSAAWYWRVGIEEFLGCRVRWPYLELSPRIPAAWPSCRVTLKIGSGQYDVEIVNAEGKYDAVVEASVDGSPLHYTGLFPRIDLRKHRNRHSVRVVLGRRTQMHAEGAVR